MAVRGHFVYRKLQPFVVHSIWSHDITHGNLLGATGLVYIGELCLIDMTIGWFLGLLRKTICVNKYIVVIRFAYTIKTVCSTFIVYIPLG